jgi:hypothetical protein
MQSDGDNPDLQIIDLTDGRPTLVTFNHRPAMINRTIFVDTNYLNQINQKDLAEMFLNPHYEEKVTSADKKQMARLFGDFRNRKVDLIFSDMVMKELIGQSAKAKALIEMYKEHLIIVGPANNMEDFFNVAAAINSCVCEAGKHGDIKDTYSYLLAFAGDIRYFVTRDGDVRPIYDYLSSLQKNGWTRKVAEIKKIKETLQVLSSEPISSRTEKFVESLFVHNYSSPPSPICLSELEDKLPDVLDRSELILWMYRSLKDIERLREYVTKIVSGWDEGPINYCKQRIQEVAQALGYASEESLPESEFQLMLVEKSAKWKKSDADVEMTGKLNAQLGILQEEAYREDFGPEYASLEDELSAEEPDKEFEVRCTNCGEVFNVCADYTGVVSSEEREMGAECCHEWLAEDKCPKCGTEITLQYDLWEYPYWCRNSDQVECENCEVIEKPKEEEKSSGSLEKFFG